jgi:hypothetical protein
MFGIGDNVPSLKNQPISRGPGTGHYAQGESTKAPPVPGNSRGRGSDGRSREDRADREHEDLELINHLRNLYLVARDHKRSRYDMWQRNYRLVNNRLGGQANNNWMPAPRASRIFPMLSSVVAWMTDGEDVLDFVPAADPHAAYFQLMEILAADLGNVINSTSIVEDFDQQYKLALWDALTYGTGIFKTVWDNSLAGGAGNATIRRRDPYSFFPDPYATCLADAEYFVDVQRMSLDEIERRWPDRALELAASSGGMDDYDQKPDLYSESKTPKANPGSLPGSGTLPSPGGSIIGRFGKPSSDKKLFEPLPGYVVYEFWIRQNDTYYDDSDTTTDDGEPLYSDKIVDDEWRVIVLCRNTILMDELAKDVLPGNWHPYEDFRFDDLGEFYGVSLVDHLAFPQIYINRLLTAMQHNAELVGNPILLEPANAGTNRTQIINRPGQRLPVMGPQGMSNAPKWLEPPSMPNMVMELVKFWMEDIENTAGLRGLQLGEAPKQRQSSDTTNSVQEAAFVRIRAAQRNYEATKRRCMTKIADLVIHNYTDKRIMAILGQDGQQTALALSDYHFYGPKDGGSGGGGRHEPLQFMLNITTPADGPTSRAARIAEADKLFAMGAVDDRYVMEAHRVRRIDEILTRLYTKRKQGVIGSGPGARQRAGRSS